MKAKLPEREPEQLAAWEAHGLYYRILESRADAPLFVLHDGPPYPTGEIHLGTGLNKILKDMIVKSKTMAGFRSPYIPGWDCHGLPIETKVEKELGGKTSKVPAAEFRRMCRQFRRAASSKSTRREFKRLGVFGQWDQPYLTMDPRDEASDRRRVHRFLRKGLRLSRTEARVLVHLRPHRAGRSRSGIRRPHQPFHLGEVPGGWRREITDS